MSLPVDWMGKFCQVRGLLPNGTRLRHPHGVAMWPRSNAACTVLPKVGEQAVVLVEQRLGGPLVDSEAWCNTKCRLAVEHAQIDRLVRLPFLWMRLLGCTAGRCTRTDGELHVAVGR